MRRRFSAKIDGKRGICCNALVAKSKNIFVCHNCSFESAKWLGKCPNCGAWNSFAETMEVQEGANAGHSIASKENTGVNSLEFLFEKVKTNPEKRLYTFGSAELNKFWGGGLTVGGLTLLAGEPGLGKSTLSLQLLRSLWLGSVSAKQVKPKLLYITAEESVMELARRSQRLEIPKEILVMQSNNMEQIEATLDREKPNVVIVDSIQTIFSADITASPGSVSQVSSLASRFLAISKSKNITIILIGHVTKEGQIAGPKTLEHLVDSVVLLESTKSTSYRTLSFSKHRFGTTDGMLLLNMESTGLQIVTDPSLALLENLETGTGVVYGIAMDKDLPLVVEIQALVSKTFQGEGGYGRREALGLTVGKVNTILAIAEKYLGLSLKTNDVYIQLTGLPKSVLDDSLDLPILLAIMSSIQNKGVDKIISTKGHQVEVKNNKMAFAGRLTLSGKIRKATSEENRTTIAKKLSFQFNPGIKIGDLEEMFS